MTSGLKIICIVYNCYEKLLELIGQNTINHMIIINNCSSDKRYYNNLDLNIIHMEKYLEIDAIFEFIYKLNIEHDKIIQLIDEKKDNFVFNQVYKYDFTKYNFENIVTDIFFQKYNFKENLDELHLLIDNKYLSEQDLKYFGELTLIGINDRKSIFIRDFYNYIDLDNTFIENYKKFIIEYIKPMYPNEELLLYQQTPNLRIGFPNLTAIGRRDTDPNQEVVGLHNDNEFGHSIYEINYILPITEMFDSNSIFYEKTVDSKEDYSDYNNLVLKKDEFFMGYLSKLKHYNKINRTGKTRISLDFRIIPYSKYLENQNDKSSVTSNKKLILGEYFNVI